MPVLGVCPTSRKTESVERFRRNWTKLFQVVEVWIELVFGLSEIAKRNPCFPERRLWPVTGISPVGRCEPASAAGWRGFDSKPAHPDSPALSVICVDSSIEDAQRDWSWRFGQVLWHSYVRVAGRFADFFFRCGALRRLTSYESPLHRALRFVDRSRGLDRFCSRQGDHQA